MRSARAPMCMKGYPLPEDNPRALIATQAVSGRTLVTCRSFRVIDCSARALIPQLAERQQIENRLMPFLAGNQADGSRAT